MKDYEMYDNDILLGVTKIFWNNINKKQKNSIIKSMSKASYKILTNNEGVQLYEVEYTILNKDELYDIVSKYIDGDKLIFEEIDKIKKYNNIKRLRKNLSVKILVPEKILSKLKLSKKDVDYNSLINAKIYFINKSCENSKNLKLVKSKLDQIIINFKSITESDNYINYSLKEKEKVKFKALDMINDLISIVEDKTNYKFSSHFSVPLKIKCNK